MRIILIFFKNIYHHKRYLIIFIFLISILCSLIFLLFFRNIGPPQHKVPGSDYFAYYEPIADSILQGKGIPFERELFINIAPGYPIFLSGIFSLSQLTKINRFDLIIIFNVIISAFSCCFLFLIAKEIFNKKIAFIASLLWMSYPFNIWFLKNPHTEVPFILLFYAGLWLYILIFKKRNLKLAFLGGLILGLASLTRWISLFLPFPLTLLIFFFLKEDSKKNQFFLAIFFLIGALFPFLLWEAYIFLNTGGFFPLFTTGPDNIVYGFTSLLGPGDKGVLSSDETRGLLERIEKVRISNRGINAFCFLIAEISKRPLAFLKLIGWKIIRAWYATSQMWWEGRIFALQVLYLVPGFLGILYGIKKARDRIREIILLLIIVFYFWGMTFLTISILRYMVPVMGLIIIFSAITLNRVIVFLRNL